MPGRISPNSGRAFFGGKDDCWLLRRAEGALAACFQVFPCAAIVNTGLVLRDPLIASGKMGIGGTSSGDASNRATRSLKDDFLTPNAELDFVVMSCDIR